MGLLDIFNDPYQPSASTGTAGLLSPEDKLMALFSGLSGAGMAMSQPGRSKSQALAMGLGGLGQGMARGRQTALQQRLLEERFADSRAKKLAQERFATMLAGGANGPRADVGGGINPEHRQVMAALASIDPGAAATMYGKAMEGNKPKDQLIEVNGKLFNVSDPSRPVQVANAQRPQQNLGQLLEEQKAYAPGSPEYNAYQSAIQQVQIKDGFRVGADGGMSSVRGGPADPRYLGTKAAATEAATLPYAGLRAAAIANAQQAAQSGTQSFTREGALRDDFTRLTTDFRTVQDAYNKIGEAAKTPTGAGDMSLLYSYVKLLDPGSVVRESEFATAAASGSLGERMQGYVNRVLSGERLPDTLRKDFLDQARGIYTAQKKGYDNLTSQYEALAKNYGVDPKNVTTRFDTPGGPPATPELPTTGYTEGTILTGPKGEQKIMRGGKWVDLK